MAVNIRGVFLGMKYVPPRMRDGGPVVNMSSALGVVGAAGIVSYVASKHAVIGMTKTAALEQGPRGIRVNAAAPGPIAGRMTFKLADEVFAGSSKSFAETVPLGRHGTPEDVAGLVSFLLSDDSSYATGTTHAIKGRLPLCSADGPSQRFVHGISPPEPGAAAQTRTFVQIDRT